MTRIFLLLILHFLTLSVFSQKKNEILVKIGGIPITTEEFIANYQKNNTNILDEKDKKTPEEYLQLYINFKLKVFEAQKLGYDTLSSFKEELEGYRRELAKPYLTDVSYNEEMIETAYYRTQHERKASHLLILVTPEQSPADTLAAWNKIAGLRKQILDGADFNEVAASHSEDPSAAQNKGLLGYFSAFQMVFPFEDMAYRTAVGQVSEIVRTRFGYHLIKVHDERPVSGEIKVAHIMKMFPQQANPETIASLKLSADSIWRLATAGADFAELAKKYSDDKQSGAEGGVMNWFTPTNMVPAFAEAAFALKNDGDISPVTQTPYGWHIIKRLELRKVQPLEKLRPTLEGKIRQNPEISKYSDEAFDRKLRAEYQLKLNEKSFSELVAKASDTTGTANWTELAAPLENKPLIEFADQRFAVGLFAEYLQKANFPVSGASSEIGMRSQLDLFINQKLLEYENTQLEKKHPDFARIYREYHDGILLFNVSKDKIWDVASTDSVRLQEFYNRTPKKYFWNDRFKGWIVEVKNAEIRSRLEPLLDDATSNIQELTDVFNTKNENNVKFTGVAAEKGDNPIVDYYIWNGAKPSGFDETTTFVHGKIVKNEQKALKDAWGLYSSDFQEQIEKEWMEALRKKYPVVINKKALKKIAVTE